MPQDNDNTGNVPVNEAPLNVAPTEQGNDAVNTAAGDIDANAAAMDANQYYDDQMGYVPQPQDGYSVQPQPSQGNYVPQDVSQFQQPFQQRNSQRPAPIIDPVESVRMTPQILVFLVLSGLKRSWKWALPLGIVSALLAAGGLYLVFPAQYEAQALIQIYSVKPHLAYTDQEQVAYDKLVATQLEMMSSAQILDKALENADVIKLACVAKEKNKVAWLKKVLKRKVQNKSEIIAVSMEAKQPDEAEKIVNAVVDAYFTLSVGQSMENNTQTLRNLNSEIDRNKRLAQTYQNRIKAQLEKAAAQGASAGQDGMTGGLGQGESLLRDAQLADTQLVSLRARRKMLEESMEHPERIPQSMLAQAMENEPELQMLNGKLEYARRKREELKQTLARQDDRRIQDLSTEIENLEKQIKAFFEGSGKLAKGDNALYKQVQASLELQAWYLDMDIRTQENTVKDLQQKYKDQLDNSGSRTGNIVDVSYDQAELARINKTLDLLSERLTALFTEQYAPEQIKLLRRATTPQAPNIIKQVMVIGMGAAMMFAFPLLLGIAVERMKPRLYHVSQVRRAMPSVLVGEIMEPPVAWVHGATFRKRMARYRESVHNWCTHLLLSNPFNRCRTLSIASVAGDDGKTFLAVQIAVAMAQMKSDPVLLIDADMRVGRLHLLFGNEETGVGLADVLSFRNGFGEAVVMNEKEPNLHLLSAGQLDVAPYELLGDGRFSELLDVLKQRYSLILVVLPPVANASESLIMSASTDSTLLCVRQGETILAAMEDVIRKLVNTGSNVDSVVVKDIPYYQMAGKDGGFADKLEQIRLAHLLQYAD